MKFAILDSFQETEVERQILGENQLICYEAREESQLPEEISQLDGCMLWHYVSLSQETIRRLTNCKAIVRIGVGFDSVDIRAAGAAGIPVCNVPDYGTNDVADHCMALLLAAARSLPAYNQALHRDIRGSWRPEIGGEIHRLTGMKLGIIGMGRIGHAVAVRAKAFGMEVLFYDPYLPDGYDKSYQVKRVETLRELFLASDYISVHAPLTEETRGMVGKELFAAADKPFTLVNTARGPIVNLDDVYDALRDGRIRYFAADVLESEPPSPRHKLIQAFQKGDEDICRRVLLTPHAAFYAQESQLEMRQKAAQLLSDLAKGLPLKNCVNKEYLVNARAAVGGR